MYLSKNVFISAEMLNMLDVLNMLNYFGAMESQKGPNRGKLIQHIQHFSQKCVFWGENNSTWPQVWLFQGKSFNTCIKCASFSCIFHISAEKKKHIFDRTNIFSAEMLNMLNIWPPGRAANRDS